VNTFKENHDFQLLVSSRNEHAVQKRPGKSLNRGSINIRPMILNGRSLERSGTIASGISGSTSESSVKGAKGTLTYRYRDLNPDVRIARRNRLSIQYLSLTNSVYCPERNLTSNDIQFRGKTSNNRGFYAPGVLKKGSGSLSGSSGVSSSGTQSSGGTKTTVSSSGLKKSSSSTSSGSSGSKTKVKKK
jgi:hypothetical protein